MIVIVKSVYGQISFEFNLHEPAKPLPPVPPAPSAPASSTPSLISGATKPELKEETDQVWIAPWLRTTPPKK